MRTAMRIYLLIKDVVMDKKMKLITYYLPQFHEFPENNRFWGKGFTEWVNVKSAKPLFREHNQPRVPYQDNYYDLSDPSVMVTQMDLAKKYGVYGFCFYHYWFNGKKIMEKPMEDLLQTPEADLPFCIAWANEPWVTTWHSGGGRYKVLIEQKYGEEKEWLEHFNYLLDFFKDERYIKIENKPMILVYNIDQIDCRKQMMAFWVKKAKEAGFNGLFIVSMKNSQNRNARSAFVSATVDFEPRMEICDSKKMSGRTERWRLKKAYKYAHIPILRKFLHVEFDYDKLNQKYLKRKRRKNQFRGVFTDYDDTPRRREWSAVVKNSTPDKFEHYLRENILKSQQEGNEYIFVNAWNEWGEGAYLEPDKKYGYGYLQSIKRAQKATKQLDTKSST